MEKAKKIRLISPAGDLYSLKRAVCAGADAVYIGFRSETNLRNFPALNFSPDDTREGIEFAHSRGKEVYITINTYPQSSQLEECFKAVDTASSLGADSIIAADIAVMEYVRNKYPHTKIHLSVQAGASNWRTIKFYQDNFEISCAILSRVLNLDEIREIRENTAIELEVFVFGSICANYEGRCSLSFYITGQSCNSVGACAPAEFVEFGEEKNGQMSFRLNGVLLNRFEKDEFCSYPTPCKARFRNPLAGGAYYPFQSPVTLNLISNISKFIELGVDAIKIEGRQRSAGYVQNVTRIFRSAIDDAYTGRARDHSQDLLEFIEGADFDEDVVRTGCA